MKHLICAGIIAVTCTWCACNKMESKQPEPLETTSSAVHRKNTNSIYYWKTVFKLNDYERQFLSDHRIGRMYIRFFDVVGSEYNPPSPEATIIFKETPPNELEIVPTVFIRNEIFKNENFEDTIVFKIANRILTMAATNDIQNIHEIQIDCDWTASTQDKYFASLNKMRKLLLEKNIELSTTIRLHQFSLPEPPVDRGVLMCYNTGNLKNDQSVNSILKASDVAPYIRYIDAYRLPVDVAYPAFSWAIWFRDKQFQSILRSADKTNTEIYRHKNHNIYTVTEGHYVDGNYIAKDDEIRFEDSDIRETLAVKHMLDPKFNQASTILFHLDSTNLSTFSNDEISQIYTH